MINPFPVLTKPNTSSPGIGLQHFASEYFILSLLSPKIIISDFFFELCFAYVSGFIISVIILTGLTGTNLSPLTWNSFNSLRSICFIAIL